jgi:cellulose synthase/poly-beta-1,6-N-acetylglucosamine synthase-like glycosyltransferase
MFDTLAEIAFWTGPAVALYVFVGFPGLVTLLARARRKVAAPRRQGAGARIPVTVVIPAFNEERHLGARIRNVLASDYPRDLLDVIVVSDASTDRTDAIASTFAASGVRLLVQDMRRGKTAGLNLAMQRAWGDIVVFTDANAEYPTHTIPTLVRSFDDPDVGLATGFTKYTVTVDGQVSEATNAYTALELVIKRAESRWGCCVGADGAVFAMRRSLYRPLRHDDINDLVLPLSVIEQGYRCVLAEEAFCSENPGVSVESEFRRQSRITNRSLRAIWRHAHLLNPFRVPAFSLFLFSHKVLRFLAPVCLSISAVALAFLALRQDMYLGIAGLTALGVLLTAAAKFVPALGTSRYPWGRPFRLLHMFCSVNVAILDGWRKFLSGSTEATWQHVRALNR